MLQKSESIAELATALNQAQSELGVVVKNSKGYGYNYADLASVMLAVKEPLANNGLAISQFPIDEDGKIGVETTIMHTSGEYLTRSFTVPADLMNAKHPGQAAGSLITYCRRYAIQAVLCLPSADDDCFAANDKFEPRQQQRPQQSQLETRHMQSSTGAPVTVGGAFVSAAQINDLEEGISRNKIDIGHFLNHFKVDSIPNFTIEQYLQAMRAIKSRDKARQSA